MDCVSSVSVFLFSCASIYFPLCLSLFSLSLSLFSLSLSLFFVFSVSSCCCRLRPWSGTIVGLAELLIPVSPSAVAFIGERRGRGSSLAVSLSLSLSRCVCVCVCVCVCFCVCVCV